MMKYVLSLLLFCVLFPASGQSVYPSYLDGQVYVKFTPSALKSVNRHNPRELALSQFAGLRSLFAKYGVTKAHIPFYQASDDEVLPYILKFHFTDITRVEQFISELENSAG